MAALVGAATVKWHPGMDAVVQRSFYEGAVTLQLLKRPHPPSPAAWPQPQVAECAPAYLERAAHVATYGNDTTSRIKAVIVESDEVLRVRWTSHRSAFDYSDWAELHRLFRNPSSVARVNHLGTRVRQRQPVPR